MAARTDNVDDPALTELLLLARRGTAYFSRALNQLSDAEFDEPSLLPGWSRRHVAAHVGYNARALARLVEGARTGVAIPMYESPVARNAEIEVGATLPVVALRNLCEHAAIHLNVEWRDLPAESWSNPVTTAQGRVVPVSETVWMRIREVWIHAVDLDNGARFDDFPAELIDKLVADVQAGWARKGAAVPRLRLVLSDRAEPIELGEASAGSFGDIRCSAADVARWMTGRGAPRTAELDSPLPELPAWL